MASAMKMLMAGLSLAGNTVALIVFALSGGSVFSQLIHWYSTFNFGPHPYIDPSMVGWIFPLFYGLLLLLEFILIYVTFQTIFSKKTYYTERGY